MRNLTIFIDIDGTLIRHRGSQTKQILEEPELLPGVLEKFNQWDRDGHVIILTTGRKESLRKITENQLSKLGIFYDQLIMGLGRGARFLINDGKDDPEIYTAYSIQIKRNEGLVNIQLI